MTQRLSFLILLLMLLAGFAVPAIAADAEAPAEEQPVPEMEAEKKDPEVEKQEEQIRTVYDMMEDLSKDLPERDQKHFYLIYTNYNLIQTVKMVQDDVEKAVKECGVNNPDMKTAMDERFKSWNDAVTPALAEADGNVDNMVAVQEYAQPGEIRKILKELDKTRKKSIKQIEKIPVTTPEACDYLRNKMDETQESMMGLLTATLAPFSQVFPEDVKPEEKAEEKTEEEGRDEAAKDQAEEKSEPADEQKQAD